MLAWQRCLLLLPTFVCHKPAPNFPSMVLKLSVSHLPGFSSRLITLRAETEKIVSTSGIINNLESDEVLTSDLRVGIVWLQCHLARLKSCKHSQTTNTGRDDMQQNVFRLCFMCIAYRLNSIRCCCLHFAHCHAPSHHCMKISGTKCVSTCSTVILLLWSYSELQMQRVKVDNTCK